MIAGTAVASIATFMIALWRLGIVRLAAAATTTTHTALATLRDSALDDAAREKAMQVASLRLFAACGSLVVRIALAAALSLAPIWLANASGLAAADVVFSFLTGWRGALIATALAVVLYGVRMPPWRTS